MNQIFLINPPLSFVYGFKKNISSILPPLGLLSIVSLLRQNHQVRFFDLEFEEDSGIMYKEINQAYIVGISLTTHSFTHAIEIAKNIRKKNPKCVIVGGGWHVNEDTWETILDFDFDILVFGEGEYIFEKIASFFKNRNTIKIKDFLENASSDLKKGIAVKVNNIKKYYEGFNKIEDINKLPFPAYDLIEWDRYNPSAHRDLGTPFLPIITARGCPFKCRYCANIGNWRLHSIEYIEKLIENFYKTSNKKIKNLIIWDDTFTLPHKRTIEMTKMLKNLDLSYSINTHPNTINNDILKYLKNSGCKIIFFGIESNDTAILKGLGRNTTVKNLVNSVKSTKEAGILTSGSVMIGTPFDTEKSIKSNVNFLKNIVKPDLCFFSPFSIEPRTAIYEELVRMKCIPPYKRWSEFYSVNEEFHTIPPLFIPSSNNKLSKTKIYNCVQWAYKYFYDNITIKKLQDKVKDFPFLENVINRIENSKNE